MMEFLAPFASCFVVYLVFGGAGLMVLLVAGTMLPSFFGSYFAERKRLRKERDEDS